jgi:DNA-binding SARP family transcriptional activator
VAVAEIALLGPLAINGEPAAVGPRDRVVLSALALRPGEALSAERLADALWGEAPPPSWNKVVSGCVMRLRRTLGADAIETTPHGYRLVVGSDDVDAQRFERLLRRGRELLALGEPDRANSAVTAALDLWRGRPLAELEGWEPGRIEADRLAELHGDAEEERLEAAISAGRHAEVLAEAQARVAEAPLRERRWALLARAQYQAGRQADALRTLLRARSVLVTQLGLDPGPDLA